MRLLLAPDLHCYYPNYGRVGPDGTHTRLAEWREAADALVRTAIEKRVDVAVFPGDFFVNARPAPQQVLEVARLFRRLSESGSTVLGCPGNHDLPGAGQPGPCDLVAAMGDWVWSVPAPQVVVQTGVQFAFLPAVKAAVVNAEAASPAEAAETMSERLLEIARGLRASCADGPRVLVGHWTVAGATASSGQTLYGGTEPVLPLSELLSLGFDAYLFGHIHKPQVLNEWPFVGYAGALQRVDFGEEDDPRGCWILDLDQRRYEWVDLPARRFVTVGPENWPESVRGAIVRVKYRATEAEAKALDQSAIVKGLYDAGAHYVAGIFPEIVRSERAREATVTESTGPLDALEKWLALKADIPGNIREAVRREAEIVLKEVA